MRFAGESGEKKSKIKKDSQSRDKRPPQTHRKKNSKCLKRVDKTINGPRLHNVGAYVRTNISIDTVFV